MGGGPMDQRSAVRRNVEEETDCYRWREFVGGPLHGDHRTCHYREEQYQVPVLEPPMVLREPEVLSCHDVQVHNYTLYHKRFYSQDFTFHEGNPMIDPKNMQLMALMRYDGIKGIQLLGSLVSKMLVAHAFKAPVFLASAFEHAVFFETEDLYVNRAATCWLMRPEEVCSIAQSITYQFTESRYERGMQQ